MRLRECRINKGFTQKEMAEAIGCTLVAYQRYESGAREPSISILKTISSVLKVSIDTIVDNPYPEFDELDLEISAAARKAEKTAKQFALEILLNHPEH